MTELEGTALFEKTAAVAVLVLYVAAQVGIFLGLLEGFKRAVGPLVVLVLVGNPVVHIGTHALDHCCDEFLLKG